MNENERPYCSHPELWPASWDEPKPLPVQMVGPCKHNLICPVCGFGWGCWPDPCDPKATEQTMMEGLDESACGGFCFV